MDIIPKLEKINKLKKDYNFIIEVDGGINNETVNYVKNSVDIIVSGSYITNSEDYQENINKLLK